MSKRLPATRPPAPRVIHYVDPATPAELAYPMNPAQLAVQQREQYRQQVAYLRWKARQEATAARDRKVRRFWLGFGAVIGLAVLTALVLAGWLLWTGIGLGILAIPAMVLIVTVLAVGGHRCITVVQHWH